MTGPVTPGPAARIRRLAVDAATAKLRATTLRDEARYRGEMHAYLRALRVLAEAGLLDDGTAPFHGTYESPLGLAELVRFAGDDIAAQTGLTQEEAST